MAFVDTFAVASDTYLEDHNEAGAWTRQGGVANAARIEADNDSVYFESTTRTAYLCPDQGSADHWSAAKLALISTSQNLSHQIAVRVTDQDNYVCAGNATSSTRMMRLRNVGTLATLVSFSATANEWVKVEAEGDTFRVFTGGTGAEPTWTQRGSDQTISGLTGTRQGMVLQQSSTAVALTEYRADAIGGGGLAITSITASNITQTGARITLGLTR